MCVLDPVPLLWAKKSLFNLMSSDLYAGGKVSLCSQGCRVGLARGFPPTSERGLQHDQRCWASSLGYIQWLIRSCIETKPGILQHRVGTPPLHIVTLTSTCVCMLCICILLEALCFSMMMTPTCYIWLWRFSNTLLALDIACYSSLILQSESTITFFESVDKSPYLSQGMFPPSHCFQHHSFFYLCFR
jgi:hypothetical protein